MTIHKIDLFLRYQIHGTNPLEVMLLSLNIFSGSVTRFVLSSIAHIPMLFNKIVQTIDSFSQRSFTFVLENFDSTLCYTVHTVHCGENKIWFE